MTLKENSIKAFHLKRRSKGVRQIKMMLERQSSSVVAKSSADKTPVNTLVIIIIKYPFLFILELKAESIALKGLLVLIFLNNPNYVVNEGIKDSVIFLYTKKTKKYKNQTV